MARGDTVEVLVDLGEGVQQFTITATKAGRTVEVSTSRGMIEVSEVSRSREIVKTDRFMATRVVALIENRSEAPEPAPKTPPQTERMFD